MVTRESTRSGWLATFLSHTLFLLTVRFEETWKAVVGVDNAAERGPSGREEEEGGGRRGKGPATSCKQAEGEK